MPLDCVCVRVIICNAPRLAAALLAIVVTLVAHAVHSNGLPAQMIDVHAAPMPAQVARFVVFFRRVVSMTEQNDGGKTQPVVVRVLAAGLERVAERATGALCVGLDQGDVAASALEFKHWRSVQQLTPFFEQLLCWFKPTNTLMWQEKFLSIRRRLCGVSSLGSRAPPELVDFLKQMFSALQIPFESIVRRERIRYSFVNYNFLFRRFFDLWGAPHYGKDFPPLKSKKKREDTILLYLRLLEVVQWPYINSDGELFGKGYHTDIYALRRRRSQHATKKQRTGEAPEHNSVADATRIGGDSRLQANADACAGGFRWECECSESAARSSRDVWAQELDFLCSHAGADACSDNWIGDDDCDWLRELGI